MSARRRVAIVGAVAALAALVALWGWRRARAAPADPADGSAAGAADGTPRAALHPRARPDPRTLPRASITGAVTDVDARPIAAARVCASLHAAVLPSELTSAPRCADADAAGHFTIDGLLAAEYAVAATARGFRPALYHPDGDPRRTVFGLATGERRAGVDLALRAGGVQLTGTVADISGGPIARAAIFSRVDAVEIATESDDAGHFTLDVAPGDAWVAARADGYARSGAYGYAPGTLDLLLTPESSLGGLVLDARTGAPVPGVRVSAGADSLHDLADDADRDVTDEHGHFHIAGLAPGRYAAVAHAADGYGRTDGSTLVGLGEHVDSVVIQLHPAYQITGRVTIDAAGTPCKDGWVTLFDSERNHRVHTTRGADLALRGDGVLPGTYAVDVSCTGYVQHDKYDLVRVVDRDLDELAWPVDAGARVTGHVRTRRGEPIAAAHVSVEPAGGGRTKATYDEVDADNRGEFTLVGLRAGAYKLYANVDGFGGEPVAFQLGAGPTAQDIVLDDTGGLHGTLVGADGAPLAGIDVDASSRGKGSGHARTDAAGAFAMTSLRPALYTVTASHGSAELRKPGTTDDAAQGEHVAVQAGASAAVRLVVESPTGVIRGTVSDATGAAVSDAFVSAAKESDAAGAAASSASETRWSWSDRPVITAPDGTFTVAGLPPGRYTVRAYRKGGGEAIAPHVAVGATAALRIKPTGHISGTISRAGLGPAPSDLAISVRDASTGFYRAEHFYMSAGRYAIADLPAGHFAMHVAADGGQGDLTFELADGEARAGVDLAIASFVSVTGRVVDFASHEPIAGVAIYAKAGNAAAGFQFGGDPDLQLITDAAGRFTVAHLARGPVTFVGFPAGGPDGDYAFLRTSRVVDGPTDPIDIGDLAMVKNRVKAGDPVGQLGVHWAADAPGAAPDALTWTVSWIDPIGPAGHAGIEIGDVVTSVDGADVTGANHAQLGAMIKAPPGTVIRLGLARGATAAITLGPPPS